MSYGKHILIAAFVGAFVFLAGCRYDKTAPEPLATKRKVDWAPNANFGTQADNAVLTSMSVSDIHFAPYGAELNSLGRTRLTAIGNYIERYGGEVIVESYQADEVIHEERLASVRQFLLGQGLHADQLTIVTKLGRGRGQDASEAATFYAKNLIPEDSCSAGQAADPSAAAAAIGGDSE